MADDLDLEHYKIQLQQVDAALVAEPENDELKKLKADLEEVINLTAEMVQEQDAAKPSTTGDNVQGSAAISNPIQWQVGDRCMAVSTKNGKFYESTIDGISEGKVAVTFIVTATLKFDPKVFGCTQNLHFAFGVSLFRTFGSGYCLFIMSGPIHEGSSADSTLHTCTSSETKHWNDGRFEKAKPKTKQISNKMGEKKEPKTKKTSGNRRYLSEKPRYGHRRRRAMDKERGITSEQAGRGVERRKHVKTRDDSSLYNRGNQERQYASRPLYKYERKTGTKGLLEAKHRKKSALPLPEPWQDEPTQYENVSSDDEKRDVTVTESVGSIIDKRTPYSLSQTFSDEEEVTQYELIGEEEEADIENYSKSDIFGQDGKLKEKKGTGPTFTDERAEFTSDDSDTDGRGFERIVTQAYDGYQSKTITIRQVSASSVKDLTRYMGLRCRCQMEKVLKRRGPGRKVTDINRLSQLKVCTEPTETKNYIWESKSSASGKRNEWQVEKERRRKKQQKKAQRQKMLEETKEGEKNKWKAFNHKAISKSYKGVKKESSIFASPSVLDGKVGVGTCGTSGQPMTKYHPQENRYKKTNN